MGKVVLYSDYKAKFSSVRPLIRLFFNFILFGVLVSIFFTGCAKNNLMLDIETELGVMRVEIYSEKAPITAANFMVYVDEEVFTDALFYRVVRDDNQPNNDVKIDVIQGGLYNDKNQSFYSGDVVYDGELLDNLEDSVVDDYISSMEKLLQLKAYEVRPGHYRSFDRRRLRELVKQYITHKKAPKCPSDKSSSG